MKIKKVLLFLLILALYIIPSIFAPFDEEWYQSLNKPVITPPNQVFSIVWTIIFVLIALSATFTLTTEKEINKRPYLTILTINYLLIQLYSYLQFTVKNLELAFFDTILVFFTSLLLYTITRRINQKASYLLIPLLVWTFFATFLQLGFVKLN
ncbi:MAG: ytaB [Haloplasmataceae bacterium]|jgi:tryptophan-rich sensory protein|nr:ytaB [Haloplasmataceae bacterium]